MQIPLGIFGFFFLFAIYTNKAMNKRHCLSSTRQSLSGNTDLKQEKEAGNVLAINQTRRLYCKRNNLP